MPPVSDQWSPFSRVLKTPRDQNHEKTAIFLIKSIKNMRTDVESRLPDAQCMHKENTIRKSGPGALKSVPEHPGRVKNGAPPFMTHFSPVRIVVLSNTSSP